MRRIFLLTVLILLFLPPYAQSKDKPKAFDTAAELKDWMSHYYLHRDASLVIPAIRSMFRESLLAQESARLPIEAFLSSLFYQNQKKLEVWLRELDDLGLEQKKILWEAIHLSHIPQDKALLKRIRTRNGGEAGKFIDQLLKEEKKPLLEVEISKPVILDMLWGQFLASGDERCVQRVISALTLLDEKQNADRVLIGGAAKWSLASNAKQHPRVLEICKSTLSFQTGVVREVLEDIVREAETEKHEKS